MGLKKTVLVTGGSGNIGRHVVQLLSDKGYKVKDFSRSTGGDICNTEKLALAMSGCWAVVHLAAYMGIGGRENDYFKVNVEGTRNVLESAKKNKVKKVVNISSIAALGDGGDFYAKSKREALLMTNEYKKELWVVNVLPTVVIDPQASRLVKSNVLGKMLWFLGGGIPGGIMGLFGSSRRRTSYVLVNDVAEGIVRALEKGKRGEDYVLSGENIEVGAYLKKMAKLYKSYYLPIRLPKVIGEKLLKIKFVDSELDTSKTENDLNFHPHRIDG